MWGDGEGKATGNPQIINSKWGFWIQTPPSVSGFEMRQKIAPQHVPTELEKNLISAARLDVATPPSSKLQWEIHKIQISRRAWK